MEVLKQGQYEPLSVYEQVLILYALKNRFLKDVPVHEIHRYQTELLEHVATNHRYIYETLEKEKAISDETDAQLKDVMSEFTNLFVKTVEVKE